MTDYIPEHATPDASDAQRRRIRTAVQSAVSACAVLLVIVPLALSTLEQAVSPQVYGVLAGAAVAVTAGATLVTRIMTTPAVVAWIDHFMPWLSASNAE